jgi:hypothetical protein
MTFAFNDGAAEVRSRERFGAGAMTLAFNDGVTSRCSDCTCSDRTLGAGGTIVEFKTGRLRDIALPMAGAGGTMESRATALRD